MSLHDWWLSFGSEVTSTAELGPILARKLVSLAIDGSFEGIALTGMRQSNSMRYAGVCLDVDVERPQDLAYSIKAVEPIAVLFPFNGNQFSVLALRSDFPDTPHQNWSPPGGPCALCIDDRPWSETRMSTTARDIARRIQLWLSKAARGELHDAAQPPDPLFFTSQLAIVLPATALAETERPIELAGFLREDNPNLILSRPVQASDNGASAFMVLAFQAKPLAMARLRHAPRTLVALSIELENCGIHLVEELKNRLKMWAGLTQTDVRRLSSRLAIVVVFPVTAGERQTVNDVRAFLSFDTAGEIGVSLGVLYANNSQVGDKRAYMVTIPEGKPSDQDLRIEPAQVHFTFDRELAATISGHSAPDRRHAMLVGAGSLGSQLAVNLAREGMFVWTVVDDDNILPHNLARHALFADAVGAPKADVLAYYLSELIGEPAQAICSNILTPNDATSEKLNAELTEADVIIDASASVAVSRHLSEFPDSTARRICAFFNPSGMAVVLLAENATRSITLRDLEAQYHRMVLSEPVLAGHLNTETLGIRYSGSCRALSNRIPASKASLLSALAARGVTNALASDDATICIWTLNANDEVHLVHRAGALVTHAQLGAWTLTYDDGLLADLVALRQQKLPNETGGILLGIVDMSRQFVHVAHALPEPEDSRATQTDFERGVVGLPETVNQAVAASMYQVRYVGEWHSHPDWASAMPSAVDLVQLVWLGEELEKEGVPGVMAIAAQDGRFTFALSHPARSDKGSPR